ncbi:MAG: methyltransferase [Candidatus Riflebacteria bacterium]|nr:methyltransferase [Candidatus Riflebacteria bacterium]
MGKGEGRDETAATVHRTTVGPIVEGGPVAWRADHATAFFHQHLVVRPGERVAEPGCGTGVLSLFCARAGAATVVGTDLDPVALAAARQNAVANGLADRVEFREGSLLEPVTGPLDLVVALLPHRPAPRPINPRLYGGPDGTDLLLAVIVQAAARLVAGGRLVLYLNSIANPRRVLAAFGQTFAVRRLAGKPRPFTREEFDALTPGLFDHLVAQKARGEAEFTEDGPVPAFTADLYEGTRR